MDEDKKQLAPADGQAAAEAAAREGVDKALNPPDTNPYHRTHNDNFDWREYHSAWQQYYQQYYHQYYSQQLHAERQKSLEDRAAAAAGKGEMITGSNEAAIEKTKIAKLKQDITDTVKSHAHSIRRSHHFVPILTAVIVGAVFIFLQFNSVMFAQVKAYVSPGAINDDALVIDPTINVAVGPEPKLIIPKINVDVPVDYGIANVDEHQIQLSLRDGATHYNLPGADAVPGQFGNTVILGHSSNDIFNQGAYKFVFVLLDRLEVGDTYYLHYNGVRYIYRVTEKKVIKPTEVAALQIGNAKPMATLITCTPPGTALNRLLIFGEQISPDPSGAAKPPTTTSNPTSQQIPGNEPSILESIWDFFF